MFVIGSVDHRESALTDSLLSNASVTDIRKYEQEICITIKSTTKNGKNHWKRCVHCHVTYFEGNNMVNQLLLTLNS